MTWSIKGFEGFEGFDLYTTTSTTTANTWGIWPGKYDRWAKVPNISFEWEGIKTRMEQFQEIERQIIRAQMSPEELETLDFAEETLRDYP